MCVCKNKNTFYIHVGHIGQCGLNFGEQSESHLTSWTKCYPKKRAMDPEGLHLLGIRAGCWDIDPSWRHLGGAKKKQLNFGSEELLVDTSIV